MIKLNLSYLIFGLVIGLIIGFQLGRPTRRDNLDVWTGGYIQGQYSMAEFCFDQGKGISISRCEMERLYEKDTLELGDQLSAEFDNQCH